MNRIEHPQNKSSTKKGLNLKWGYLVLSLAVLVKVIVLAVGQIPKTNLPSSVEAYVWEEPGRKWAYENDLFYAEPIVRKQDSVTLTIWGVVLSPYATEVIYSVDGLKNGGSFDIVAVDGRGVSSYQGSGLNYDGGFVNTVITYALTTETAEEHTITLSLPQRGNISDGIVINLQINPHSYKEYYQVKKLDYAETINGITLKVDRVIYSPVQIYLEYLLTGEELTEFSTKNAVIHKNEIALAIDGKKRYLNPAAITSEINKATNMHYLIVARPDIITADTKLVLNNGSYPPSADATIHTAIEGPWEIPLPVP